MGCLPSRSTIAPAKFNQAESGGTKTEETVNVNGLSKGRRLSSTNSTDINMTETGAPNERRNMADVDYGSSELKGDTDGAEDESKDQQVRQVSEQEVGRSVSNNRSFEGPEDELMSILTSERTKYQLQQEEEIAYDNEVPNGPDSGSLFNKQQQQEFQRQVTPDGADSKAESLKDIQDDTGPDSKRSNLDYEPNMELLRQYVAVDYEIMHLEDKDALRVYHEKIEQLEQLERELDLISSEADEVARGSEVASAQLDRTQISGEQVGDFDKMDSKMDLESNSMISGVTGSISHKSNGMSEVIRSAGKQPQTSATSEANDKGRALRGSQTTGKDAGQASGRRSNQLGSKLSYSTIEDVFNRKIILEKERDKLKMEVESTIVECDKLQQRYKRRDEILDKLFDGRTGNGLENHLEQQLNWLLEQKHYVDQVFYAWKRAETLTSQTCEQFLNAIDMLKRLNKIDNASQRQELIKNIRELLIKSGQDMELAQKYNPNVDAPFFTETETKKFNKTIESLSSNPPTNANEISSVLSVVQFAYKRAVSIRMWLEQILQTTIARDSFELAEEYKWIAIQLRKERINLIKAMLHEPPYRSMAQAIKEQVDRQQKLTDQRRKNEVNRDSGIDSETNDIDIEEEIYRLLEMNRARLEAPITNGKIGGPTNTLLSNQNQLRVGAQNGAQMLTSLDSGQRDQRMQDMIDKRVKGDRPLRMSKISTAGIPPFTNYGQQNGIHSGRSDGGTDKTTLGAEPVNDGNSIPASPTQSKLKVELDEESRQNLLQQVNSIHDKHRSKIERLRGNNRAKANSSIKDRMQKAREQPAQNGHREAAGSI